jgi:hypothetical protein
MTHRAGHVRVHIQLLLQHACLCACVVTKWSNTEAHRLCVQLGVCLPSLCTGTLASPERLAAVVYHVGRPVMVIRTYTVAPCYRTVPITLLVCPDSTSRQQRSAHRSHWRLWPSSRSTVRSCMLHRCMGEVYGTKWARKYRSPFPTGHSSWLILLHRITVHPCMHRSHTRGLVERCMASS